MCLELYDAKYLSLNWCISGNKDKLNILRMKR